MSKVPQQEVEPFNRAGGNRPIQGAREGRRDCRRGKKATRGCHHNLVVVPHFTTSLATAEQARRAKEVSLVSATMLVYNV